MEKLLKLFTYVDGRNDTPFPNEQEQVVVSEFRGDYKRMGATPTLSCTVMHHKCLDKLWTDNVYATFNGEKFFIKQTASSSYDNTDSRYKHEVELVSERIILDNVYFYDVVSSDTANDKPVSNSSNVVFFGDIHEFANRLNYSLQYSNVGYSVVVDDGIASGWKMMSFQDQFFSNVLQEIYNTYEIPYYFVGKVIHIGYTNNAITHTFKYGVDESLLSIQKQNANYKLVNRVTGVGSADNIPYYYPNDYESKEEVEKHGGIWINPQTNLMPSIYRETLGEERFYKALNDTYVSPETGEYYHFENPFVDGKPKEHIVNFDEIKPSIKGMVNASNQRIDMFVEFAYDANDNDETDEEGNYLHPYFFAKLRKFDGEYGFNLFDHAIDEQEMIISMISGSCGACEWIIGVDEESQKNTVQVDNFGNLVRDTNGKVKFGTPQDRQNDTKNNEVWIALKKDIDTFGVIMPNATSNYKPSVNDTFVILHIDLPKSYILSAENNLKEQLIKYMAMNNSEKFTFSISFSRIFFAENPDILAQLNENARIQIEYDNTRYELYVSSYSYNMSNGSPLPEIKVELSDTLSVQQNALQNAISEVKQDIMSSVGGGDFLKQGLKYFLRKDTSDRTRGKLSSDVGFEVGKYVSGASGAIIYKDAETGQTVGEIDKLYVRMKAYFETLVISEVDTISGKQIISPAGSIKCLGVEELDDAYRCYFLGEQDGSEVDNLFHENDQAYSQTFNAKKGEHNNISNTYYWRLITNVSINTIDYKNQKCHYIDLSKSDCDKDSDVPKEGDIINHRGSRTDVDRMNFIESSSVDAFSPNITLFHGVNSYSLDGKDYVSYGVDKTNNKAYMNVYGDMFVGDRNGSTYMRYTPEEGLVIKGKLDIETKLGDATLKDLISASTPDGYQEFVEKVTQDIEGLQQQIDGAIESYFYQYAPTLDNYPASSWNTKELKDAHLNDTFTNLVDGRSWRWTIENSVYKWTEITDTATTQALALAGQAKDTADGKRRVFVSQPTTPYDKGDLWSRGKDYPLLICGNAKGDNGIYEESDWDYADNSEKIKQEMQDLVGTTKDELNNAIGQATEAANTYTDSAKQALQDSINELNKAKANVNDVYSKSEADGVISKAEQDAINAAKQQADAAIELSQTIVKAYADGIVDDEESARIKQAQENLAEAKKYAEQKAQEALNDALSSLATFDYLKSALKEDTTIEGGLVQSSLLKLGYTLNGSFKVMSGTNGIYNSQSHGGGVASWWGGDIHDILDYYTWNGSEWVVKSNANVPTNMPSGVIRFDGTGYLAKGKFWWDNNGQIHADPTALLLSFDATIGDETLASTIVNIRKDLAKFMDMWEVKKLSDGTEYLYSKRHLATNGGVSMYSNVGDLDIPSIYDGLPIDGSTIYWDKGTLKAKSSDGGSTIKYPLSWSGFNQGTYDGSQAVSFYIPTALSEFVNDKNFATTSDLSGYLPLNGGTLIGNITLKSSSQSGTTPKIYFQRGTTSDNYYDSCIYNKEGSITFSLYYNNTYYEKFLIGNTSVRPCTDNELLLGTTTIRWADVNTVLLNGYTPITANNIGDYAVLSSSYTASDILSKLLTVDGSGSGLDADLLDGLDSSVFARQEYNNNFITSGNEFNFVPSAYTKAIWINYRTKGGLNGSITAYIFGDGAGSTNNVTLKATTFTGNSASATKLQTPRTIWGQSFDGTADVDGNLTVGNGNLILNNNKELQCKNTNGENVSIITYSNNNALSIGTGVAKAGRPLYIRGLNVYLQYGTNNTPGLYLKNTGNILIGTETDSGYKLDVNGSIHTNSNVDIPSSSSNGYGITNGGNSFFRVSDGKRLVISANNGDIFLRPIGTTSYVGQFKFTDSIFEIPSQKLLLNGIPIYKKQDGVLYIEGNLAVKGGITMFAEDEIDIPTFVDSLPFDETTIWYNPTTQRIEVKAGAGGGINESQLANYLTSNNYAKKSDIPTNTNQLTNGSGYITGITKSMVTTALGFTPYNSTNPNGYTSNTGTVTKVSMTVPTGLSVSGSGFTTSGTLAVTFASGYSIPTTSKQSNWDMAYGWGNHANAGYAKSTDLSSYQTKITSSNKLAYSLISGTPTSLPASDVYAWAKADTKPSYNFGEIGAGVLSIGDGANRIMWRTYASCLSGLYYSITGNESVVFANKNYVTSWIFATANPTTQGSWLNLTPSLQIKNQRVTINKLIASGKDAEYNLDVNGSFNATTGYINKNEILHAGNYSSYALPLSGGTVDWINIRNNGSPGGETPIFLIYKKQGGRSLEEVSDSDYIKWQMTLNKTNTYCVFHCFGKGTSYISNLKTGSSTSNLDISGSTVTIGDWQGSRFYFDTVNTMLGIGTPNPIYKLDTNGTIGGHFIRTSYNNTAGFSEYESLNYGRAWFSNEYAYAVPYNSVQVALGWSNWLEGQGYHTRYTISSVRFNGWGGMSLAVGASDDGTYRGCYLELWGSGTLSAGGNLLVSGGITMYSDARKKTILNQVELSLKQIANAPLIQHYYNSDQNKTTHVGSIAQYWYGMNDWFCKEDSEGFLTMEIQNCALASAISIARELDRYETKTDKTIRKMKQRIAELEEEVERLKQN